MRPLLFLLTLPVWALVSACGPDAFAWRAEPVRLTVSEPTLTFPPTPVGGQSRLPLTVTNHGDATTTLEVRVGAPFSASRPSLEIGADASVTLEVVFGPTEWAHGEGLLELLGDPGATVDLVGPLETDADGDGAYALGAGGTDCDDDDPTVFPGASDPCGDAVDADCDPVGDDDCDADGHPVGSDCDDADAAVFPGATETGPDGRDEDCDGRIDEVLAAPGDVFLSELAPQAPAWIEVCNAVDRALALDGYTVETAAGAVVLPAGTVDPGACAVICAAATRGCAFEAPIVLDPTADTLTVSVEDVVLDTLTIDAAWSWEPGFVWSLDPASASAAANDLPAAWCRGEGSPGEPNGACP